MAAAKKASKAASKPASTKGATTPTATAAAPAAAATKPAAAAKPAPAPKDSANGVTRPRKGSSTGRIWEISDGLAKGGKTVKRADVLAKAEAEGINAATAATQYGKWRRYSGIVGREATE